MSNKQTIVVSGINMTDTGKLSILADCLDYLSSTLSSEFKVIALVPNRDMFSLKNIEFIEFPKSKKSWFARIYYEYFEFYFLSKKIRPYLWLSLHDITPNVRSTIRAVYCHNASIFYKVPRKFLLFDKTLSMFSVFYRYLYNINIKKNNYVIVQQQWLKKEFENLFSINNVVVAHPVTRKIKQVKNRRVNFANSRLKFFYPTHPRIFKNIEVIIEAVELLNKEGYDDFEIILTFNPDDNEYTKYLIDKYKTKDNIKYVGSITREEVYEYYNKVDYLIFPSLLESWGLPISEAIAFGLPMLVAKLPYSYESIGSYEKSKLFNPYDPKELAGYMKQAINRSITFDSPSVDTKQEYLDGWSELFDYILRKS